MEIPIHSNRFPETLTDKRLKINAIANRIARRWWAPD
jgi:hypothetical protein